MVWLAMVGIGFGFVRFFALGGMLFNDRFAHLPYGLAVKFGRAYFSNNLTPWLVSHIWHTVFFMLFDMLFLHEVWQDDCLVG